MTLSTIKEKALKLVSDSRIITDLKIVRNTSTVTTKVTSRTLSATKPLSEQLTIDGIIYYVSSEIDMNGKTAVLPASSTLHFKPGGLLKNGTLKGTGSTLEANSRVLDNVSVTGTWAHPGNVLWWATGSDIVENNNGVCYIPVRRDDTSNIQLALDSAFRELIFPPRPFYVTGTLVLKKEKHIVMQGSTMRLSLEQCQTAIKNTAILFTDKDIPLLRIAVDEGMAFNQSAVTIQGGNFDVSLCPDYTSNCIEVRTDDGEKMWGLNISTSVKGKADNTHGCGININPVENRNAGINTAFVTQVRIKGDVQNFGTGIKATNYMDWSPLRYYNWCTDVQIDSNIINCPMAIDCNTDCSIAGMIQAGHLFLEEKDPTPLIRLGGDRTSISSNIFDPRQFNGQRYSNYYVLEITYPNAAVTADGLFRSFMEIVRNQGFVKGHTEHFIA